MADAIYVDFAARQRTTSEQFPAEKESFPPPDVMCDCMGERVAADAAFWAANTDLCDRTCMVAEAMFLMLAPFFAVKENRALIVLKQKGMLNASLGSLCDSIAKYAREVWESEHIHCLALAIEFHDRMVAIDEFQTRRGSLF